MRISLLSAFTALVGGALLALPVAAAAQGFPSRPVTVVVPWPAGGVVDVAIRVITEKLATRLGQPVIVDNRPGANGIIGMQLVARSAPDGYTLIAASAETQAINPHAYAKLTYATSDFAPVTSVIKLQHVLTSRSDWPATSVPKTLEILSEKPGKFTYASWGVGSIPQVAMEMLLGVEGQKALHVPFNGGPAAFSALMAGQVDLMVMPVLAAKPFKDGGKIKVLGIAAESRAAIMKDIPTLEEQGYNLRIENTVGFLAPAATPATVIEKIHAEIAIVLDDPAVRTRLSELGSEVFVLGPSQYTEHMTSEYQRWGEIIKRANIQLQN